jgi:ubiquinol-cytochrome c reductase cytochrome c subunit
VPAVPNPHLGRANQSAGQDLFSLNCAACHTIEGAGDALAENTNAPSLQNRQVTAQQVAEAIRTGPANMPRFSGNLTDQQVSDIVSYVTGRLQHPENPGGFALGGVGPVAEGFVALLIGVGGLALICFWIGERSPSDDEPEDTDGHGGHGGGGDGDGDGDGTDGGAPKSDAFAQSGQERS